MDLEKLRLAIYDSFATTGRAPTRDDLATRFGLDSHEVIAALTQLATLRHLALDSEFNIAMAHPFSSVPLGFSVMGKNTLWWGGCAWDSFALPHLLTSEGAVLIATTCPNCEQALSWKVNNKEAPLGTELAHFLVPAERMWQDVVYTCGNQRIFCNQNCIDSWLSTTGNQAGYIMDLLTLWNLASNWYAGRLEAGYVRREPSAAKDYLRTAGLSGSFWGLD